jgi:hydrogenase expression/formation protein HypD
VGFETTAPTVAATVVAARRAGLANFSVWPMFKLIPPALRAVAAGREAMDRAQRIDGFLLPGHVSTIIGSNPYRFLAREFGVPCVVAGFEALDVLQGILMLLGQLGQQPKVEVQYGRSVKPEGNVAAQRLLGRVFGVTDAEWRGLGRVARSGLSFRAGFSRFDASRRFRVAVPRPKRTACRCGEVMLGSIVPPECGLFGRACAPEHPVGPCMVSSEGACAAYYRYDR